MELINAVGRRKTAVSRVYLKEGTGKITINDKDLSVYFPNELLQYIVLQPLKVLGLEGKFDIKVNLKGGGFRGQAEALRHAIARALVEYNEEYRTPLKVNGFLKRDPREVERKKYGQKKARKRFQFSKR
jgi:small subunit ribosomal protein S9